MMAAWCHFSLQLILNPIYLVSLSLALSLLTYVRANILVKFEFMDLNHITNVTMLTCHTGMSVLYTLDLFGKTSIHQELAYVRIW